MKHLNKVINLRYYQLGNLIKELIGENRILDRIHRAIYNNSNYIDDKLLLSNIYDFAYIQKYNKRFEKTRELLFNIFLNHYNINLDEYDFKEVWKIDNLIVLNNTYPRVYPKLYGEYIQWLVEEHNRTSDKEIFHVCKSSLSNNLLVSNANICIVSLEYTPKDLEEYIIDMKQLFIEDLARQIKLLLDNPKAEYFGKQVNIDTNNYELVKEYFRVFYNIEIEQQYRRQDIMLLDIDIKRELNKIGVYDFYSLDI